ncbi:hypothetical protein [Levilactobacillus zymae]|uniref:hypothetical protein n=1 Tax=Levilactobacillus zymae TaxID=267363 RepID=UPI0028B26C5B|nr:hypothetical protein [Levilactobacillus zymae]MDT6980192.1 hypothetical protein [Levilactobacillus zymae]
MKKPSSQQLAQTLVKLQYGQMVAGNVQNACATTMAVCRLIQPALRQLTPPDSYYELTPEQMRQQLGDRDRLLAQIEEIMKLLDDKVTDIDELTGNVADILDGAVSYLSATAVPARIEEGGIE